MKTPLLQVYAILVGLAICPWLVAQTEAAAAGKPLDVKSEGSAVPSGPRIEFEKTTIDIGKVPVGSTAAAEFKYKNVGTAPLSIESIKVSCKRCSAVRTSDGALAPGKSEVIRTSVSGAKAKPGKQTFSVLVATNDPGQPQVALSFHMEFQAEVSCTPEKIALGDTPRGAGKEGWLQVRSLSDKPLKIVEIACNPKILDVKIQEEAPQQKGVRRTPSADHSGPKKEEDGAGKPEEKADKTSPWLAQETRIRYSVNSEAPLGPFWETLQLKIDNPRVPVLSIPISGNIVGPVALAEDRVSLGFIRSSQPIEKVVRLSASEPDFKVVKTTTDVPGLQADSRPVAGGYAIHLRLDPGKAESIVKGKVVLKTSSTEYPTLEIAVSGIVKIAPAEK